MVSVTLLADIAQFVGGGALTVAASKLSIAYGPSVGALAWVVPVLLYVSVAALRYQGQTREQLAKLCFDSFGTTVVNAMTGVLLGVLILVVPGPVAWALLTSLVLSIAIGYGYHRLF